MSQAIMFSVGRLACTGPVILDLLIAFGSRTTHTAHINTAAPAGAACPVTCRPGSSPVDHCPSQDTQDMLLVMWWSPVVFKFSNSEAAGTERSVSSANSQIDLNPFACHIRPWPAMLTLKKAWQIDIADYLIFRGTGIRDNIFLRVGIIIVALLKH